MIICKKFSCLIVVNKLFKKGLICIGGVKVYNFLNWLIIKIIWLILLFKMIFLRFLVNVWVFCCNWVNKLNLFNVCWFLLVEFCKDIIVLVSVLKGLCLGVKIVILIFFKIFFVCCFK